MGRKPKVGVSRSSIPAVQKAFAILEFFCSSSQGHTITEVSRVFRMPVSTCSSLLYTLVNCGYLSRDEKGAFSLSMRLLGQASMRLGQLEISDIAEPELEKLTMATSLASALFVRDGDQVVCVAKVEGPGHIRTAAHVGKHMPLHATCTGKAMAAYMPDEELEKIIKSTGLPEITANTITSVTLLKRELARVRAQGYAVADQEYGIGVLGISAPVFDSKGRFVAAISASGATFEFDRRIPKIASSVKAAALEVSKSLGYSESTVNDLYRPNPEGAGIVSKLNAY